MKIFISYSRLDNAIQNDRSEAFLDLVVITLERLKHTVWLDRDLSGGQAWWSKILAEIESCDVVVFLMTPLSTSDWSACLTELEYARKLGKPILPIQLLEVSGTISPSPIEPRGLAETSYTPPRLAREGLDLPVAACRWPRRRTQEPSTRHACLLSGCRTASPV